MSVQDPLHLDEHSEPQPDLMLLKPAADYYRKRHPLPEDVFLLVEVSDTTLELDREEKLPAYGRAGILEVWIVDLNHATIEVYREPHFTGYSQQDHFARGRPGQTPGVSRRVGGCGRFARALTRAGTVHLHQQARQFQPLTAAQFNHLPRNVFDNSVNAPGLSLPAMAELTAS